MRKGDVLVVWRLDRLARSVRQLVDTAADRLCCMDQPFYPEKK